MTDPRVPDLKPPTSTPTEWSEVEWPLLLHLARMGWQTMAGDIDVPELTERENFRQVVLYGRLREAAKRINAGDGPVDDLTKERNRPAAGGNQGICVWGGILLSGQNIPVETDGDRKERLFNCSSLAQWPICDATIRRRQGKGALHPVVHPEGSGVDRREDRTPPGKGAGRAEIDKRPRSPIPLGVLQCAWRYVFSLARHAASPSSDPIFDYP